MMAQVCHTYTYLAQYYQNSDKNMPKNMLELLSFVAISNILH
jgi:hypothetical protein